MLRLREGVYLLPNGAVVTAPGLNARALRLELYDELDGRRDVPGLRVPPAHAFDRRELATVINHEAALELAARPRRAE